MNFTSRCVLFRADLHCHSCCSDGTHTPKELIDLAKKQNLQGLSITDHDTVAAYTEELFTYAEEQDLLLITGVEFSTHYQEENVHVLGYDIVVDDPTLLQFCQAHQQRREARKKGILQKLKERGMPIAEEEVEGMGRPHIAKVMIDKGYVASFKEAFDDYIGDNALCYVRGDPFSIEETLAVIKGAGGKAFLAHPIFIEKRNILQNILEMGFDGIECYYAKSTLQQSNKMLRLAEKYSLSISGGSDFHGDNKAYLPLGAAFITEEHFFPLYKNSKKWIAT